MTTSLDLIRATIIQKRQSGLFHYAFGPIFELVAAQFYAFVEATESASHLTNREQTSYELKVKVSMKVLDKFFASSMKIVRKDFRLFSTLAGLLYRKC